MYADGRLGMIKPNLLGRLLDGRIVTSFMRSDGWAVVGRDTIRRHRSSNDYDGAERRSCFTLGAPEGRSLMIKLLQEVAWIACVLVLTSILFSGLL
jgi:hypothetical protein